MFSDHCFGILEGRGRLLHHDPGAAEPLTLALCQPVIWSVGQDWFVIAHASGLHCQLPKAYWFSG